MRKTLIDYYRNVQMLNSLGEEPPLTLVPYSVNYFSYLNRIIHTKDDFTFDIARVDVDILFGEIYEISIEVDKIIIYKNKWIHTIPKKMRVKLNNVIKIFKSFNKECKLIKVKKRYNNLLKTQKLKEKQLKRNKFENERQKLIEKFTSKH